MKTNLAGVFSRSLGSNRERTSQEHFFSFSYAPPLGGIPKICYRLIELFPSTVIFSKRRKISSDTEGKPEHAVAESPEKYVRKLLSCISGGKFCEHFFTFIQQITLRVHSSRARDPKQPLPTGSTWCFSSFALHSHSHILGSSSMWREKQPTTLSSVKYSVSSKRDWRVQ